MAGSNIRATDDEALASQLWGDDKEWDDERKQFVPTGDKEEDEKSGVNLGHREPSTKVEEEPSAGTSSQGSSEPTKTKPEKNETPAPASVPSTAPHSSKVPAGNAGASGARTTSADKDK